MTTIVEPPKDKELRKQPSWAIAIRAEESDSEGERATLAAEWLRRRGCTLSRDSGGYVVESRFDSVDALVQALLFDDKWCSRDADGNLN